MTGPEKLHRAFGAVEVEMDVDELKEQSTVPWVEGEPLSVVKHWGHGKGTSCSWVCLPAGVSEPGEPELGFEVYQPGASLRGTAEQQDVDICCCLASKRQSRGQNSTFSLYSWA